MKVDKGTVSERLKILMEEKNLNNIDLAEVTHLSPATISRYLNALMAPKITTIEIIAKKYEVNPAWLLGFSENKNIPKSLILAPKDEKDIARKLESILDEMNNSNDALMFDGEKIEMDTESQELLRSSIENSLRLAKKLAKEKYTPKKYKK